MDVEPRDHDMVALGGVRQTPGVEAEMATRYATDMACRHRQPGPTLAEMYGWDKSVDCATGSARNLNDQGLGALDLHTCKENCDPLDFTKKSGREIALMYAKT